jgi:hypothetical protein
MTLAESATQLVDSIVAMPGHFADVAAHDPLSAALIGVGALVMAVTMGAFGYLSLGAFFSLFTVDTSQGPRREAR